MIFADFAASVRTAPAFAASQFIYRCAAAWLALAGAGVAAPGDVDPLFNPNVYGGGGGILAPNVIGTALQPDGRVLLGGTNFSQVGGVARSNLARVNADGTLDTAWNPSPTGGIVASLAALEDGRVLIGGTFTAIGGLNTPRLALVNPDGTVNGNYAPAPNGSVASIWPMDNGKVLIGGEFGYVGGHARARVARLNANGSVDTTFDAGAIPNGWLYTVVAQPDGKVLIAGWFTSVNGTARTHLARLSTGGALDTAFNPLVNDEVRVVALQRDGKILLGGKFTQVGGQPRNRIARLNADGTLDAAFNPAVTDTVISIALQADGKIVFSESLGSIEPTARNRVARVNPDGTGDPTFAASLNKGALTLNLQRDGAIVTGGGFTTAGGLTRNRACRLLNDPATDELTATTRERVQWLRGGTTPEAVYVRFELSTDGGATWNPLGLGTRFAGGWEKSGLSLPLNGRLRARARTTDAKSGGSLIERVREFSFPPPNRPPEFAGYHFSTPRQTTATVAARKLLAKATDPDGDAVTLTGTSASSAMGGTVALRDGAVIYTPAAGYAGEDGFAITLTDARGAATQATVGVVVTQPNPQGAGGMATNPPTLQRLEGGQMDIRFQGIPGRIYQIQRSVDLSVWQHLATVTATAEGLVHFIDGGPLPPNAYYRLAWPAP
ncbi:MAG: Ig-like domain-containing protein [Akkermansiaceae bacterium]|nr:Ig-like domain-containing protein [Akkermansiaceae bacterium]